MTTNPSTSPSGTESAMVSWVEPYVTGRLSPEDEERFEEFLLENPELAQRVEDGLRLRRGLSHVAVQETAVTLGAVAAAKARRPWIAGTAIAGLALVGSLVWFVPRVGELQGELAEARGPQVGIPVVALEATRGSVATDLPTLNLGDHPWFVFTLEPSHPDLDFYLVHLQQGPAGSPAAEDSLWRSPTVAADALGRVTVTLPRDLLSPGPHHLRIEGIDGDGPAYPAGRFAFEVVADRP